jgi:acetyl esterase/lipase
VNQTLGESSSWLLWPDAPGVAADAPDFVCQDPGNPASDIIDVHRPRVFAFKSGNPDGRAALVLAGGGYTRLVVSYEGVDVARWLNSLGLHAFLLVHRFPAARWASDACTGAQAPVDDAIEAMRQVRARSAEFGIRRDGLGALGLSSGGHLAACLVSRYPATWTPPASEYGAFDARPDFMIVGYAPISTNATGRTIIANKPPLPPPEKQALYEALQPDVQLIDKPPPTFIVYSAEDPVVPVENAFRLGAALRARGVAAETHIYERGAHGFALREQQLPIGQWPAACAAWMSPLSSVPISVHPPEPLTW